jgi:flagellar FliJ protein
MARRFRFTLQKVLDLRSWEETQAETALAAKTGQCAACERAIQSLLSRRRDSFLARAQGALDLSVLAAHDAFGQRLGREIETKQKELARLTVEREDLLKVYLEKRKRRDVLSKLSEKQALAFKQAEAKRENLRIDDLNTASFIRKMTAVEEQLG